MTATLALAHTRTAAPSASWNSENHALQQTGRGQCVGLVWVVGSGVESLEFGVWGLGVEDAGLDSGFWGCGPCGLCFRFAGVVFWFWGFGSGGSHVGFGIGSGGRFEDVTAYAPMLAH